MIRRVLAAAGTVVVALVVPLTFAGPAEAGCAAVAGDGVCEYYYPDGGYFPSPTVGSMPVNSPTQICYVVGCIWEGQTIANVPIVGVQGGQVACIHIDYICRKPINVPDIP